jgi:hypothetical protein
MAKPATPMGAELRPILRLQPGETRPAPKSMEHLRPHLLGVQGTKPTIEKGTVRPKLREASIGTPT